MHPKMAAMDSSYLHPIGKVTMGWKAVHAMNQKSSSLLALA
jgi:hypothetical protein